MHRSVIFLLTNVVLCIASVDRFLFDVSLTCHLHHIGRYSYKIQFVESDFWVLNKDDIITPPKFGEALPGSHNFTMFGKQEGDEITSEGYDVRMLLTHNCNGNREDIGAYMYVKPLCPIGTGLCHFKISRDITDMRGKVTMYANLVDD